MRILIIGVSLMLMACQAPDQEISGDGEQANIKQWRMVMDLPGGGTPVNLEITDDELPTVTLVNGIEKVKVPQVTRVADGLMLRFPAFNNQLHLKPTENGYQGHLKLVKQGYFQSIPLTLTPEQQYRFTESPVPEIDVTGRWGVTFVDDEGKESFAVGEFDQQGGQLTGTFLTALGDYRFLAGDVDGRNMKLSTFDGAHAFLFTATMDEGGILSGDFWSGTRWHESWTARKNFDATLPDPTSLTYLEDGQDRLEFSFPNLEGQPVSLADEKYQGKIVIVALAGTWCPNCHDEAAFLAEYFATNQYRGLEIVSLLFEHLEDFDAAAGQGRAFRDKFAIKYDLLIAGSSNKAEASKTLPILNKVSAYPTMIFIDRQGKVRQTYTGFSGPGTGDYYSRFQKVFTTLMDDLLAEST